MTRLLLVALSLLASVSAQEPAAAALPRLLQLGPAPAAPTVLRLHADGALAAADGARLDLAGLARLLAQPPANLVLQVDRQAPFALVGAVLHVCREQHVPAVQFAAALPDGKAGTFTLALPEAGEAATTLDLRLHRDRPGVPPDSARLLLQRMQRGLAAAKAPALVLGIEAPGDAPFEQVLQTLAAMPPAEVRQVVLRCALTNSQQLIWQQQPDLGALAKVCAAAPAKALAMDLGPAPCLQVLPLALPPPQPGVRQAAVGCTVRAPAVAAAEPGGGAGGRFGGRQGARAAVARGGDATARAIETATTLLQRLQQADGSFADTPGKGDIEATALLLLACLGDGSTMASGLYRDVIRRGVGWLLAEQRHDGRIGDGGAGCTVRHALATYALAEACGLSADGKLLRGGVRDALDWLAAQQQASGGFGDGAPGAVADTITTAWSMMPLASAKFFGFQLQGELTGALAWFDQVVDPATGAHRLHAAAAAADDAKSATATAAALFSRFFAGQAPQQVPVMGQAADLLLAQADPEDALAAYWTTYALYQMGGRHWATWSRRLTGAVVATQVRDGEFQGTWQPPPGGSRLVTTALRVLTLEAYYRYTRLVR